MNPKVATIVPLSHLEETISDEYFMALSLGVDNPEYQRFFLDRAKSGAHVIIDNSAIELGSPEPFEVYLAKARSIWASEIMLPDTFLNAEATIDAAEEAVKVIGSEFAHGQWEPQVMIIPQGQTIPSWLECCNRLVSIVTRARLGIPTIGISCRYTDVAGFGPSRIPLALMAHREVPVYPTRIHFLGCYGDPRLEVYPVINLPFIQGVDSSYASVYAQHGYELTPDLLAAPRPARHIDFIKDHYDTNLLRKNIGVWRSACQRGWL